MGLSTLGVLINVIPKERSDCGNLPYISLKLTAGDCRGLCQASQ